MKLRYGIAGVATAAIASTALTAAASPVPEPYAPGASAFVLAAIAEPIAANVDVDTAYARIKREFGFSTEKERLANTPGVWGSFAEAGTANGDPDHMGWNRSWIHPIHGMSSLDPDFSPEDPFSPKGNPYRTGFPVDARYE